MWAGLLSDNGRPAMIAGIGARVRRWCSRSSTATAAGTAPAAVARSRRPKRYPIRPCHPPATTRPLADWPYLSDRWADQWREIAWWQAFINSGQLAIAEWLPADTRRRLAIARRSMEVAA